MRNDRALKSSFMIIRSTEKIAIATKNLDKYCFVNLGIDIVTPWVFFSLDETIPLITWGICRGYIVLLVDLMQRLSSLGWNYDPLLCLWYGFTTSYLSFIGNKPRSSLKEQSASKLDSLCALRSQWLSSTTMPECFLQAQHWACRQSRRNFRTKPGDGK